MPLIIILNINTAHAIQGLTKPQYLHRNLHNMQKVAFVIGGSGSVGESLIKELAQSRQFAKIISFGRKSVDLKDVTEVVVSMNPSELENAVIINAADIDADIIGFSTLGVGAKTKDLTYEEHCAIDVDLNRAFAAGLKKSKKSKHFLLMTAAGANPKASIYGNGAAGFSRYNRVKGETEEAAKQVGPEVISIFRPAMIIGSKHTPRVLEKILPLFSYITPKKMLSIKTSDIAKSMLACAMYTPQSSAIYHYPEMMEWIAKT